MPSHVLVIREAAITAQSLPQLLGAWGYHVSTVDLQGAADRLYRVPPDLVLLSIRHLGQATRPACRELCQHARSLRVPVALLVEGCDGAGLPREPAACLVSPLSPDQVAAVIEVLLQDGEARILAAGEVRLRLDAHRVYSCGNGHHLSPQEFRLLETFLRHPVRVLTRRFLMREVWDTDFVQDTRTLDVHIHWIRKKIEPDPRRPRLLRTVRGVGYHFMPVLRVPRSVSVGSPSTDRADVIACCRAG